MSQKHSSNGMEPRGILNKIHSLSPNLDLEGPRMLNRPQFKKKKILAGLEKLLKYI